jgi:hypothetical protein
MTHADALNKILAHSCPRDKKDGILFYHLDLCCHEVYVKARYIGDRPRTSAGVGDYRIHKYEILSVDLVDHEKMPNRYSEL